MHCSRRGGAHNATLRTANRDADAYTAPRWVASATIPNDATRGAIAMCVWTMKDPPTIAPYRSDGCPVAANTPNSSVTAIIGRMMTCGFQTLTSRSGTLITYTSIIKAIDAPIAGRSRRRHTKAMTPIATRLIASEPACMPAVCNPLARYHGP